MLKKGKLVVVFYRGAWYPHCNKHISHLQYSFNFILDKAASVITVTPETELSIDKTISKTKATFNIIHDSAYVIMKKYGVAFKVSDTTIKRYKYLALNLRSQMETEIIFYRSCDIYNQSKWSD